VTDWYRVTRYVAADEPHNDYGSAVAVGSVFPEARGPLYGAVDLDNGIALAGVDGAFFEFPRDAVVFIRSEPDALPFDPSGNGPIRPEVQF
jgi:hypothetical protein